ncbi:hypothetical protein [Amorphus sp. MBR-141]
MDNDIRSGLYLDNWPKRRRWMALVMIWMAANVEYLVVFGDPDSALHQQALVALIGGIFATLGSYVFGAVWDDVDKRKRAAGL